MKISIANVQYILNHLLPIIYYTYTSIYLPRAFTGLLGKKYAATPHTPIVLVPLVDSDDYDGVLCPYAVGIATYDVTIPTYLGCMTSEIHTDT